jgi:hypothetical protein
MGLRRCALAITAVGALLAATSACSEALPERAREQCARLQAHVHFAVLCPGRCRGRHAAGDEAMPLRPSSATFSGALGAPAYARGYGLRGSQGIYWANHTWFFWREHGTQYAASLHYFGRGTTALLARLIRELRRADRFR